MILMPLRNGLQAIHCQNPNEQVAEDVVNQAETAEFEEMLDNQVPNLHDPKANQQPGQVAFLIMGMNEAFNAQEEKDRCYRPAKPVHPVGHTDTVKHFMHVVDEHQNNSMYFDVEVGDAPTTLNS